MQGDVDVSGATGWGCNSELLASQWMQARVGDATRRDVDRVDFAGLQVEYLDLARATVEKVQASSHDSHFVCSLLPRVMCPVQVGVHKRAEDRLTVLEEQGAKADVRSEPSLCQLLTD